MYKVFIFGTGKGAAKVFAHLVEGGECEILGFLDNNSDLHGTAIFGYQIFPPEQVLTSQYDTIFIASQFYDEIKPQLLKLGVAKQKISFPKHLIFEDPVQDACAVNLPLTNDYYQQVKNKLKHLGIDPHQMPPPPCMEEFIPFYDLKNAALDMFAGQLGDNYLPNTTFRQDVFRTLWVSVEQAFSTAVDGDVAEFGCGSGQSSMTLAKAVSDCNNYYTGTVESSLQQPKQLHLFDSFEGLPKAKAEADLNSPHVSLGTWAEGGGKGTSAQELSDSIRRAIGLEKFSIYEGWYENTLADIKQGTKFSVIHLDCDLWESTFTVMNHLFGSNIVAEGAILLFDDWSCNKADERFGQRRAWNDIRLKYNVQSSDLGFYGLGCHRKIIHSYG